MIPKQDALPKVLISNMFSVLEMGFRHHVQNNWQMNISICESAQSFYTKEELARKMKPEEDSIHSGKGLINWYK